MRQSATLLVPVGESEEKAQEQVRWEGAPGHPFRNLGRFQASREALYRRIAGARQGLERPLSRHPSKRPELGLCTPERAPSW